MKEAERDKLMYIIRDTMIELLRILEENNRALRELATVCAIREQDTMEKEDGSRSQN